MLLVWYEMLLEKQEIGPSEISFSQISIVAPIRFINNFPRPFINTGVSYLVYMYTTILKFFPRAEKK